MLSEFQKYPRWCPKCKALHQAIWKECTICKAPLISSLWRFPAWFFKTLLSMVVIASILGSFCVFTYFAQKSERHFYKQSYEYFKEGHYEESWDEFGKAFRLNPVACFARWSIGGIGKMFGTHSASSSENVMPGHFSTLPSSHSDSRAWTCRDLSQRNPQSPIRCGGQVWLQGRLAFLGQPQFAQYSFGGVQPRSYQSRAAAGKMTFMNWLIVGYVLISGLLGLVIVRPPLIGWYHSQQWFIFGTGLVDILLRLIGFRVTFELLIFCVACLVGSLGGNLFVLFKLFSKNPT